MPLSVKIQLPSSFPDPRADRFNIYRILDNGNFSLLKSVPIGVTLTSDSDTSQGASYYYTALDSISGNESMASPIARVFRRVSTTPRAI